MSTEMYEVMEVKGKPGLTVGSNVLKPGQRFSREDWNFPQLNLDACIKSGRCKKIKVEEKKEDSKADKIKALEAKHKSLDPNSGKAKELLEKIKVLKS